jgi:hypothetical protein
MSAGYLPPCVDCGCLAYAPKAKRCHECADKRKKAQWKIAYLDTPLEERRIYQRSYYLAKIEHKRAYGRNYYHQKIARACA